jgi:hypothetical protein
MLERIAGPATFEEFAALKALADVVEPVKEYTRDETAPFEATNQTPMNRIVDAVSLESNSARRFSDLVDRFLGSSCSDAATGAELRRRLAAWSTNDAAFSGLAQKSFLAREAAATSRDLSAVGNAGLAALDAICAGKPLSAGQQSQFTSALAEAAKPKIQLLLVPVPAVQKLVKLASESSVCVSSQK